MPANAWLTQILNNKPTGYVSSTFDGNMILNEYFKEMDHLSALKKVSNEMFWAQKERVSLHYKVLDLIKDKTPNLNEKIRQLSDLYFETKQEKHYLNQLYRKIKAEKAKNPENPENREKLSEYVKGFVDDELRGLNTDLNETLCDIMDNINLHNNILINDMEKIVDIIQKAAINLSADKTIIKDKIFKSNFQYCINHAESINNRIKSLDNLAKRLDSYNDKKDIKQIIKSMEKLVSYKNSLDKKGLTKFIDKGLLAELAMEFVAKSMLQNELMQSVENKLQDMQDMTTLLEDNLAKYTANPQDFDANYNFQQDIKGYNLFLHWRFAHLNPSTKRDNDKFVDSFMNNWSKFFELKDSEFLSKEEQSKLDQIMEMGNKLSTQLAKSDEYITAFLSKVTELESQIPTKNTIKTNENIESSAHPIMLEEVSDSTPSLESKPQLDNFSIMLDKIKAMKTLRGNIIKELKLEYAQSEEFSTLSSSFDKLFKFNDKYELFTDSYHEYIDSLYSEDDIIEESCEEEDKIRDAFSDNFYSQNKEMKKINDIYSNRLFDEESKLTKNGHGNIDFVKQLKSLTTKFIAQNYVQDDKYLIEKYARALNRLDALTLKSESDAVDVDILRNSINNKSFDTVESSMTINSQNKVMNLPVIPIEMNG